MCEKHVHIQATMSSNWNDKHSHIKTQKVKVYMYILTFFHKLHRHDPLSQGGYMLCDHSGHSW